MSSTWQKCIYEKEQNDKGTMVCRSERILGFKQLISGGLSNLFVNHLFSLSYSVPEVSGILTSNWQALSCKPGK